MYYRVFSKGQMTKIKKRIFQFFDRSWYLHIYPFLFWYRKPILIGFSMLLLFAWAGVRMGFFRTPLFSLSPIEAIPQSVTIIFETKNCRNSLQKINNNQYSEDLTGIALTERWVNDLIMLDSLFAGNEKYRQIFDKAQLVSGAQINGANNFEWLYVFKHPNNLPAFASVAEKGGFNLIHKSSYRGQEIYEFQSTQNGKITICRRGDLLLISRLTSLVEASIEQLDNIAGSLSRQSSFQKVKTNSGSGDVAVFINFNTLSIFLSMIAPTHSEGIGILSNTFDWAGLDLRMQDQNFVMSGHLYHKPDNGFWDWLATQSVANKKSNIGKFIPDNVAICTYLNINNFDAFYRKNHEKLGYPDFDKYILPWLGTEAAFYITEPTGSDFDVDKFVLLKAKDIDKAKASLLAFGQNFGILDSLSIGKFEMLQLAASAELLAPIFGNYLKTLKSPYYCIVEDYVLFCNSASVMELWVESYGLGKMLDKSAIYKPFVGQMQDKSSLYLFINTPNTAQLLKSFIRPELEDLIDKRFLRFRNLTPIGIQLSAFKDHFLLTASASHNEIITTLKTNVAWRCNLKAAAAIEPAIVKNHDNKELEIFVQDVDNRIYLINRSGQIIWEKPVDGRILSEISQVDFYENHKLQYAFNTQKSIYIIDRNGELIKRIPLVSKAINGLLSINYGKGLRLFVAGANGNVYGFDKNGKPLSGWNPNSNIGSVQFPMRYVEIDKKDYVIAMNRTGRLHLRQRNGKGIKSLNMGGYYLSDFVVDLTAERMVFGASNGKIEVVNFKGKKFSIAAPEGINKDAHFALADVCNDAQLDYIRHSKKILTVHAYDTAQHLQETLRYRYETEQQDIFPIKLVNREKACIGSYDIHNKKIWLINAEGQVLSGFPLVGTGKFKVLDLFNDNNNTLLVANGKQIFAYKLKL